MQKRFYCFYFIILLAACQITRTIRFMEPALDNYKHLPKIDFPAVGQSLPYGETLQKSENQNQIINKILASSSQTEVLLIIKDGKIIFEHYAQAIYKNQALLGFSISKSFVSTTLSIAVTEGLIHSLNDPVTHYLPELLQTDSNFNTLTLQDLLNMQSGIRLDESSGGLFSPIARMYYGRNIYANLKHLTVYPDWHSFRYLNINTQILAKVIERVSHMNFQTYFYQKLWSRLKPANQAHWMIDDKKHQRVKAFVGFAAVPTDLARLGILYANNGVFENDTILSPAWIESIAHPDTLRKTDYKNHFWTNNDHYFLRFKNDSLAQDYYQRHEQLTHFQKVNDSTYKMERNSPTYQAYGFMDQFMCINPKNKVVVLRMGYFPKDDKIEIDKLIRSLCESIQ
ncbi:MAG TPA: serine hydrolase [Bacteroidia bacterium]